MTPGGGEPRVASGDASDARSAGVVGYTDRLSYRAGDVIAVMADAPRATSIAVELVKLAGAGANGDVGRAGNGVNVGLAGADDAARPTPIAWEAAGAYACGPQTFCVGSFVAVEGLGPDDLARAGWWGCWICPTLLADPGRQGIMGTSSDPDGGELLVLAVEGGNVVLTGREPSSGHAVDLRSPLRLESGEWYAVGVEYGEHEVGLRVAGVDSGRPTSVVTTRIGEAFPPKTPLQHDRPSSSSSRSSPSSHATHAGTDSPGSPWFTIGASAARSVDRRPGGCIGIPVEPFNGKIEAPYVLDRSLRPDEWDRAVRGDTTVVPRATTATIAAWAFSGEPEAPVAAVPGTQVATRAHAVNLPTSGVTGVGWRDQTVSPMQAPHEYAALHFHDDDLLDVGWDPLVSAELPSGLASGLYGVRLRDGDREDILPFVVAPTEPVHDLLVVLPTFTYLAYGNERMFLDERPGEPEATFLDPRDRARIGDPAYGLSHYDCHRDGSGVVFSSCRRPIANLRHDYRSWLHGAGRGLSGDLYLLDWLHDQGIAFDLATDVELHARGHDLLGPYRVLMTGSHPEYCTGPMLDAISDYRHSGGHLMYLGGNGFYQVTGVLEGDPLVTEVRRGMAGVRAWESAAGEATLVSTGEPGGLWRHRGRAPQRLAAVGFCAQGWDGSSPYVRTPASDDPGLAWIFAGTEGRVLGDRGAILGGAAADEIDRADRALGTPPDAIVLATTTGLGDGYQRAVEEVLQLSSAGHGPKTDPDVRADLVYVPPEDGIGGILAAGSIAWTGSLAAGHRDPNVSRVTENVLRRWL